jgi:hypothetical protein
MSLKVEREAAERTGQEEDVTERFSGQRSMPAGGAELKEQRSVAASHVSTLVQMLVRRLLRTENPREKNLQAKH